MIHARLQAVETLNDIDFTGAQCDADGDAYAYVRGLTADDCPDCIKGADCAQKVIRLRHQRGGFVCVVVHGPHSLN